MAIPTSVPNFVTGWTSRPMPFDTKKRGERARLSNENAAVERMDPEAHDDGCLVYTARPLPLGCVWNMTVTTTSGVARGLVSGGCMSLNTHPCCSVRYSYGPRGKPRGQSGHGAPPRMLSLSLTVHALCTTSPALRFYFSEDYSKTSEERTLWDRGLCPLFRGCPPLGGCPFFTSKPYSVC